MRKARIVPAVGVPKKVEVAMAVGTAVPAVPFARTLLAAMVASPMVWPEPRVVRVPVRPLLMVAEVVAMA